MRVPNNALAALLCAICRVVDIEDVGSVVSQRRMTINGLEVRFWEIEQAGVARIFAQFDLGAVPPGRTLQAWRLVLEANGVLYATSPARMALGPETGAVLLVVELEGVGEDAGADSATRLEHFAQHGLYWQLNILSSTDEQFDGIASGTYVWIRC